MKSTMLSILVAATLSITGSQSFANSSDKKFSKDATIPTHVSTIKIAGAKGEPTFKGSESFLKAFPNALVQRYEIIGEMTKVSFSWNGDDLDAYYNEKGTLVATSHFIDSKNLPISIRMNVQKEYEGYEIVQATEFNHSENGLHYFLIVKNAAKGWILQVNPDGEITELKKLKN